MVPLPLSLGDVVSMFSKKECQILIHLTIEQFFFGQRRQKSFWIMLMASSSCICGGYSELCSHQIILCGFMKFANHSILFLFAFYAGSQLFDNLGCSCHKTACKFSVLVMPLSWEWSFLHTAKIMCKMLMPSSTEIWIWTPRLCSKWKKMQCKNQIQITNASYQRPWETLVLVIDA